MKPVNTCVSFRRRPDEVFFNAQPFILMICQPWQRVAMSKWGRMFEFDDTANTTNTRVSGFLILLQHNTYVLLV